MKYFFLFLCILLPLNFSGAPYAKDHKFTLVLDAGHGGDDPGAVGKKSQEKNINLAVTLLVGKKIEKAYPDVKVIYTRDKDITVSLPKRSQIANKAKADLFISIHANAADSKSAKGAEVFVYGPKTSNENLKVLERENEITFLEDEFKGISISQYLNPVENSIIMESMQMVFHENSFTLASLIQEGFVSKAKRGDRGVKSGNLAVLRNASMPSVLIELDFISHAEAENYMISKSGQETLAQCIFNAFTEYKRAYDLRNGTMVKVQENNKIEEYNEPQSGKIYKVQILTAPQPVDEKQLKGYKAYYYIENGRYKYTHGESSDWEEISNIRKSLLKDFQDAFIITFENGKRIK